MNKPTNNNSDDLKRVLFVYILFLIKATASGDDDDHCTSSDEEEDPESYCKGGYHPTKIGDVFKNRYDCLKLAFTLYVILNF